MDMRDALSKVGFDTRNVEVPRHFDVYGELCSPYYMNEYMPESMYYSILSDCNKIEKSKKAVDLDMLKSRFKPVDYDPVYAWVLRNSSKCRVVDMDGVRYGYTNLELCIMWNTSQCEYTLPWSMSKWYRSLADAELNNSISDVLDEYASSAEYVPIILPEDDGIIYTDARDRSDESWVRGINILKTTREDIVAIRSKYKISKYAKYLIKQGRNGLYLVRLQPKISK